MKWTTPSIIAITLPIHAQTSSTTVAPTTTTLSPCSSIYLSSEVSLPDFGVEQAVYGQSFIIDDSPDVCAATESEFNRGFDWWVEQRTIGEFTVQATTKGSPTSGVGFSLLDGEKHTVETLNFKSLNGNSWEGSLIFTHTGTSITVLGNLAPN